MRYIAKPEQPPDSIRDYVTNQTQVGHGLDYRTFASTASPLPQGGSRAGQLCDELTHQQFGLCAYTGVGIDSRLGTSEKQPGKVKFSRHNEHMKSQSACRDELISAGKTHGVDLGEDMDHRNIVAALLVSGGNAKVARTDLFGAAYRENDPIPILPTDPSCEKRFSFNLRGAISETKSSDQPAADTIKALNLKHEVLRRWREEAIGSFVDGIETPADVEILIERLTNPVDHQLPEYCFAIRQVVRRFSDAAT